MVRKSFFRPSALILAISLLTSRIIRASSSVSISAMMVWPVRTLPALNSMEPMVQASVNMRTSVGLSAGLRALPDFSRSSDRVSSAARRERSIP